jgi:ComF family protein
MLNVLFPKICNGCKSRLVKQESVLCMQCRHDLPLACFHRSQASTLKDLFYGRVDLEQATALVHFQKKGITQEIMHNLKYRGQKDISNFFGKWLGAELILRPEYQSVTQVIPVPLHAKKLKKRGYNQVSGFGKEIAAQFGIPFREDILLKVSQNASQVFKKRWGRFEEEAIFTVNDHSALKDQHVLLVDDIVTTGATIEKCALKLLEGDNVKLSVATIAIA